MERGGFPGDQPRVPCVLRGLGPTVAEIGGAISDLFSISSLGLWRPARLPLWPLQSLLETSSWHAGLWPALPPLFIEALGWEPGLLRAFLWPAPITSLRKFSAKLWLKLWPEGEKGKMGEGKEWVLGSSKQSCGAREDHLAGAAWSWDCVGLGFQ